jgi:hypothetical protein
LKGGDIMGMTDKQFVSYRKEQLDEFEDMLIVAKKTNADEYLIKKLERNVEKAKSDIEA